MDRIGRVVILNGTTSAGKSTLIDAFCKQRVARRDELWMRTGLDDYMYRMPIEFFELPGFADGRLGAEGFRIVERAEPLAFDVGPTAQVVLGAYRRTVGTWARHGLDVIVDEVVLGSDSALDWTEALAGIPALWIAVRCSPEVAAQREIARGDRVVGLAAGQAFSVHEHVRYGAEVDTTEATPEACAAVLESAIDSFTPFRQRGPGSAP
jgi:chloramphenicol 3-O phosphotransferase